MVKPSKGRYLALSQDFALSYLFGWLVGERLNYLPDDGGSKDL
jgi:hypothetical protein